MKKLNKFTLVKERFYCLNDDEQKNILDNYYSNTKDCGREHIIKKCIFEIDTFICDTY